MITPRFRNVPRTRSGHVPAPILMLVCTISVMLAFAAGLPGCGSAPKPVAVHHLPENVMVQPRGAIGLVLASSTSPLPTAMRALGIPYRSLPLALIPKTDLSAFQILIVDEQALDQDIGFATYANLIENVKKYSITLLLLYQQTETMQKASKVVPFKLYPRDVEYRLVLTSPRHDDPVMTTPNPLTRANLDSMSVRAHQLVHGGVDSRAIVSANLDAPDSSGVFLWEPRDRGAIWYLALPVAARAAEGYEAEQKVLANLLSNK